MIAKIKQVKANVENNFEIYENDILKYKANTPWMSLKLPFQTENVRKLSLQNQHDESVLTTRYDVFDNLLNEAIPMKYLVGLSTTFDKFEILKDNQNIGSFYILRAGVWDKAFFVEINGKVFKGYSIAAGYKEVVVFFEDEKQIAQITKPLSTINNLDEYLLHILDGYNELFEILAFFTIYYDYKKYNNSGEIVSKSAEISFRYTFGKNSKKYDENWILNNFGITEAQNIENTISASQEQAKTQIKSTLKLMLICAIIIVPIVLLLTVILFFQTLTSAV